MMSDPVAPLTFDGVGDDSIPELVRLGEQLMRAREGAGLSLGALAARLRMEPHLLQALEQGDHRKLPEGVFVVALARRIAGTLNVDVEEGITSLRQSRLMDHKPPGRSTSTGEGTPPLAERAPQAPRRPAQPPPIHRRSRPISLWGWPLIALLAALGAAAAWLLLAQSPSRSPSTPPELEPTPAKPLEGTKPPGKTDSSTAMPPTVAASPSPGADGLRLQASEPSWLEVRDANGKTLFEGTLTGERTFPLGRGLQVMAGRPYAVRASIGAGRATPLGGVDDIRWKRFGPEALKPTAPPPPTPAP